MHTSSITETIIQKISEIEEHEDVKIIHCIESGSRAWGFASPDSDYDVRFFYVRKPEFYLKLEKTRDVIEWQLDETLDINGWDIKKALTLLHKSNPTLFEWNNSPIVYKTTEQWKKVQEVINTCFVEKPSLYHYLSTAKSNNHEFLKDDIVKLKKYFYVLRPLLACKWIISRKCPPPMLFSELMEAELEPEMRPAVNDLLRLKMQTPEIGTGKRIEILNDYIDMQMVKIQSQIDKMENTSGADWKMLNNLFLSILYS